MVFPAQIFPVSGRCFLIAAAEGADEVFRILIADLIGDFRYCQIG